MTFKQRLREGKELWRHWEEGWGRQNLRQSMEFFRLQKLHSSYVLRITFLHILHSTTNNNLRDYLPHFTDKEAGRGKILVQNQRTSYQSKTETQLVTSAWGQLSYMFENVGAKTQTFWNGSSIGRKTTAVENRQYLEFFSTELSVTMSTWPQEGWG